MKEGVGLKSKQHWEEIYSKRAPDAVSWFQPHAETSLRLIQQAAAGPLARVIDVGGGASTLIDDLLAANFVQPTVLDLSGAAIAKTRQRLGKRSDDAQWIEADITQVDLPAQAYDVWHDRAVFHFLTDAADRAAYVRTVLHAVKPGGHVIVATFAEDGPLQCSGLPVVRYQPGQLHAEFGQPFELVAHEKEAHQTPGGAVQQFVYCFCRRLAG